MKAIVNVSKSSAYAEYNGHTFEVSELLSMGFSLNINGVNTDFSFKEVLIVDVFREKKLITEKHMGIFSKEYAVIKKYLEVNQISDLRLNSPVGYKKQTYKQKCLKLNSALRLMVHKDSFSKVYRIICGSR